MLPATKIVKPLVVPAKKCVNVGKGEFLIMRDKIKRKSMPDDLILDGVVSLSATRKSKPGEFIQVWEYETPKELVTYCKLTVVGD